MGGAVIGCTLTLTTVARCGRACRQNFSPVVMVVLLFWFRLVLCGEMEAPGVREREGGGRAAGYVAPLDPMRAEIAGAGAQLNSNNNTGDVFAQSQNAAKRKRLAGRRLQEAPEPDNESRGPRASLWAEARSGNRLTLVHL